VIVMGRHFTGPPEPRHRGYTCGLLAREIDGPAAVTLHVVPPLERQLALELDGDDRLLPRSAVNPVH
jgi:hypothetical protein